VQAVIGNIRGFGDDSMADSLARVAHRSLEPSASALAKENKHYEELAQSEFRPTLAR